MKSILTRMKMESLRMTKSEASRVIVYQLRLIFDSSKLDLAFDDFSTTSLLERCRVTKTGNS
jgi:hypothetical protein